MTENIFTLKRQKSKFSREEDELIKILVQQFGCENWALIASKMKGRTTRQCRERYINYLDPEISKEPWTEEEDALLIQKKKELGSHWKSIADFFPHRTDIHIKNRWSRLERRRLKLLKKETETPPPEPISATDTQQINFGVDQKQMADDFWISLAEPSYMFDDSFTIYTDFQPRSQN